MAYRLQHISKTKVQENIKSPSLTTWSVSPPSPIRCRSILRIGCRNCNKAEESTFFKLLIACMKILYFVRLMNSQSKTPLEFAAWFAYAITEISNESKASVQVYSWKRSDKRPAQKAEYKVLNSQFQ